MDEKEFAVIREISNNYLPDQRTIARKVGISLGITNLIIKRLVRTGYIKIKQLNRKKIQYILTPKGFSEKAKKSYNYTLKTIKQLRAIREGIQELILKEYRNGKTEFIIEGEDDLADITELAFKNLSHLNLKYSRNGTRKNNCAVLLTKRIINHLANSGIFYQH